MSTFLYELQENKHTSEEKGGKKIKLSYNLDYIIIENFMGKFVPIDFTPSGKTYDRFSMILRLLTQLF
jgi:hypothetical protein